MDLVHDQLATGRKLRVLTIVDTFSRFAGAGATFRGSNGVEVLERVVRKSVVGGAGMATLLSLPGVPDPNLREIDFGR